MIDSAVAVRSQKEFAELTGGPDHKPECKWDDDLVTAGVVLIMAILIYLASPMGEGWWLP